MSDDIRLLRSLLSMLAGITVASAAAMIAFPAINRYGLPPELVRIIGDNPDRFPASGNPRAMVVLSLCIAGLIASIVGLWWFRQWPRIAFTTIVAVGAVFLDPSPSTFVNGPAMTILSGVLNMLTGAILLLIWVWR